MNRLAEILLNKSLEECSIEELQLITKKYPFFNAGHLLAVQKLQNTASDQLSGSIQKANLHFKSVYINQVISEKGNAELIPGSLPAVKESAELINEGSNETKTAQPDHTSEAQSFISNEIKEKLIADLPTEDLIPHETHSTDFRAKLETEDQLITDKSQSETIEALPDKQDNEFDNIPSSHNDELVVSKEQSTTNQQEKSPDDAGMPIVSVAQPATGNQELTFQPYHTVDYFASQGIKVKLDENPTDKFSKQLKSFTEWLKTLKKLPDAENMPVTNAVVEKRVDQLAEISLNDSNVVTEAMAEVWAKQGNHQKAIEIYHKLSLLEPSKSTYFASLIEDLKKASL